jgi:hypothetical protein
MIETRMVKVLVDDNDPAYFVDCPICVTSAIVSAQRQTPFFLAKFRRGHSARRL